MRRWLKPTPPEPFTSQSSRAAGHPAALSVSEQDITTIHSTIAGHRRDIALEITTKILAELDRGVMPWRKPWDGARTGLALPRHATGENYRGVNVIMLWSATVGKGYASPYWITLRQANQIGAHVRKVERGEMVVYDGQAIMNHPEFAGGSKP